MESAKITDAQHVLVVTGAGISVESGIQPFRGKDGIWEENPMEMATFRKYMSEPASFLSWYYKRFISCLDAAPNVTHDILAANKIRVITQNIDGLHRKAGHDPELMIEIHGCLNEKRVVSAVAREEIVPAEWNSVNEKEFVSSLFHLFQIGEAGYIDEDRSYRPHVLLFDEYYTDLYQIEKAMDWVSEADTILFMGTSNSVGITDGILRIALQQKKKVMVVDPNPAASFKLPVVELFAMSASDFCRKFF